ncbi:alkene reductase [Rhodococcus sp. T2V]|uniref:alkene reductase n=1 Tax=Rhodococcus sp. T2V TaxID=3034164 RepID=UPI0023E266C4|nr:alkene reductase [Rhodococcus sp. T2V]MDF3311154.1 alkene reductase [Rhodococcus sp. T2V]
MTLTDSPDLREATLFQPLRLGAIELSNRIVMAPMTRTRTDSSGIPGELIVEYYRQRASLGLIITEGTYPSFESQAFGGQPGLASDEQAAGWRHVVDAVHAEGGKIVVQIQHGGRTAHPDLNGGRRVIAPSPIAIDGQMFMGASGQQFPLPQEMTSEDIAGAISEFADAARRAIEAGFDGVEVHAANGYLLHQFLAPSSNVRTDNYGGSPENRARFAVEVTKAVVDAIGADRVGLRISPEHNIQDALEPDHDDVLATYGTLLDQLRPLGLAYLSVLHAQTDGELIQELQRKFAGKLLVNSGFFGSPSTSEESARLVELPFIDGVVVGRAALANPDLVDRWKGGHGENEPVNDLFYATGPEGYTDYPALRDN